MTDTSKTARRVRAKAAHKHSGIIRIHPRGFGFIHVDGIDDDFFAPEPALNGIIDGDTVMFTVPDGGDAASRVSLSSRRRTRVVADCLGGRSAVVDRALGQLAVTLERDMPAGHAVVCDLDGRILEDLGVAHGQQALARRVLERHQLPHARSQAAESEAQAFKARRGRGRRADLHEQLVVTIDDDSSTDLDDALAVAAGPDGSLRVWVHIADVAEHVLSGSAIDGDAAGTPTSIYLPSQVRHMLPEALSAGALSLLPGVERDTLTCELRIDASGQVASVDVYASTIRSAQRLSYHTVGRVLTGESAGLESDIVQSVRMLRAAATRLGRVRAARGGVDAGRIDPEPAGVRGEDAAHLLIERLMVATNEAIAQWCHERGLPVLYRTHAAIDGEDADALEAAAAGFGLYAGLPRPVSPQAFAALAEQAEAAGVSREFWDAVAPLLARAAYTTGRGEHFGLGSPAYCHFTSPLRRYADLLTHRVVKGYLDGQREEGTQSRANLEAHAQIINEVSRAAAWAERDMRVALALAPLKARQVHSATVVGVAGKQVRVSVDGHAGVIGFLPKGSGERIGQKLRVRVRTVDALRGTLALSLAGDAPARPGRDKAAAAVERSGSSRTSGRRAASRPVAEAVSGDSAASAVAQPAATDADAVSKPARKRRRRVRSQQA